MAADAVVGKICVFVCVCVCVVYTCTKHARACVCVVNRDNRVVLFSVRARIYIRYNRNY